MQAFPNVEHKKGYDMYQIRGFFICSESNNKASNMLCKEVFCHKFTEAQALASFTFRRASNNRENVKCAAPVILQELFFFR